MCCTSTTTTKETTETHGETETTKEKKTRNIMATHSVHYAPYRGDYTTYDADLSLCGPSEAECAYWAANPLGMRLADPVVMAECDRLYALGKKRPGWAVANARQKRANDAAAAASRRANPTRNPAVCS